MSSPYQLSSGELFWVLALCALLLYEFLSARLNPNPLAMFSPTLVLGVVLAYYALLGPLRAISLGEWYDRGINMRNSMVLGWSGACIFYLSVLAGFNLISTPPFIRRFAAPTTSGSLSRLGSRLCQIGFLMFILVTGPRVVALINPLTARDVVDNYSEGIQAAGFANYFRLALNLLIPGIVMLWASWLSTRRNFMAVLVWFVLGVGIFTTAGFRYRIILAIVPLLLVWYLARRARPNLVVVSIVAASLIFVAGFVGLTREYGKGLDLSAVESRSNSDIFDAGFGESNVFLTTSGMLAITPAINSYVGLQPILSTLLFPIPSALLPNKDSSAYLQRSINTLFDDPVLGRGSAILCYGEWYLMAGWPSLVAMSVLLGWGMRCLWNWFLLRSSEPIAQCCYAISVPYLYVVVSRGYMPQVVMLFFFTVAPMFWLYQRLSLPVRSS